jgi:hypothetical protein
MLCYLQPKTVKISIISLFFIPKNNQVLKKLWIFYYINFKLNSWTLLFFFSRATSSPFLLFSSLQLEKILVGERLFQPGPKQVDEGGGEEEEAEEEGGGGGGLEDGGEGEKVCVGPKWKRSGAAAALASSREGRKLGLSRFNLISFLYCRLMLPLRKQTYFTVQMQYFIP